ncbi:MAG: flagellar biosynthesis protein FlhB [Pseudomonadota bacterium]
MAEEQQGQEKTEEPTPRKLEKAKDEGQIARSRELNSVAIVTFGALAAIFVAPDVAKDLISVVEQAFSRAADQIDMTSFLGDLAGQAFLSILPLGIVLFLAGIFSSIGVGGFVLSGKALQPKLSRMSLIKGFGRMFSSKSMVELGKSLLKFVLISAVAVLVLAVLLKEILYLSNKDFSVAALEGVTYVGIALLLVGIVLVVIAAVDVPFQMAQHKKQLRMTKQEVKDELKDSEGKPEVKAKIRSLQQQLSQRKMLEDVPEADVVITNPEHFSVAVKYDANVMAAPILLAKGVDNMAMKIREVASGHDVPLVAAPPLARAIYYNTDFGEEIPEDLYVATAQVLAYVYQLEQYRRGQLEQVPVLGDVEIPPELDRSV